VAAKSRALVVVVLAATAAGAGLWLLFQTPGSKVADCDTVHHLLDIQEAGVHDLAQAAVDDPDMARTHFDDRIQSVRETAQTLSDGNLRRIVNTLADLDATIVDAWAHTVATPSPAGVGPDLRSQDAQQYFLQRYQQYSRDRTETISSLLATCPRNT